MQFETEHGALDVTIDQLIIAGWTGRDAAAVQHHIDELAAIGVAPPSEVPLYYRVSRSLLTTDPVVEVLGEHSSGEAEPMILRQGDDLWLGLGSDHTDRELEATSVAASKQVCPKPCSTGLWSYDSVAGHLDQITVRSWIEETGAWVLYQDGALSGLRPLDGLRAGVQMADRSAMMCGTFGAIGGVRPASKFRATMTDPVLGREITMTYEARSLPVIA
ncbi:DUF2848 domain-containing protein [Jannaschia sp. 2305UL9-9]|uniref:DUF2848 domain-containing protein n=1 Tax=Jannaschia sp. 2305UL9-9 TaxID=3121638 RepID=UPI003529CEC1